MSGSPGAANAAHLMHLSPLLYSYQLSMAQQALGEHLMIPFPIHHNLINPRLFISASGNNMNNQNQNMNDVQRHLADLQRQYLMEMMPKAHQQQGSSRNSR